MRVVEPWENARRVATLRELASGWSISRALARGRKPPCRVCGFIYRSRTTGACLWCHVEQPAGAAELAKQAAAPTMKRRRRRVAL